MYLLTVPHMPSLSILLRLSQASCNVSPGMYSITIKNIGSSPSPVIVDRTFGVFIDVLSDMKRIVSTSEGRTWRPYFTTMLSPMRFAILPQFGGRFSKGGFGDK